MPPSNDDLGALVLTHLLEITGSTCSIREEDILAVQDDTTRDILAGLLTLHEELEYREKKRQHALLELKELNAGLERRVASQAQAILELSTPVLEIWQGILALPLIGAIDTKRAQQIIENVLEAVVKRRASVVIMDVTGVPIVDSKVADHLLKTVDAARMLGAQVILTGVSPLNAQTLVKLGVDLGRLTTKSTLLEGLKFALQHRTDKTAVGAVPRDNG